MDLDFMGLLLTQSFFFARENNTGFWFTGCVQVTSSGPAQQVGQSFFSNLLLVAFEVVKRLYEALVHNPTKPKLVEKDDLFFWH